VTTIVVEHQSTGAPKPGSKPWFDPPCYGRPWSEHEYGSVRGVHLRQHHSQNPVVMIHIIAGELESAPGQAR
jgi:hypothetical protein